MSTPPPLRRPNGFWAFLRVIGRGFNVARLAILNLVFFVLLFVELLLVVGGVAGSRLALTI